MELNRPRMLLMAEEREPTWAEPDERLPSMVLMESNLDWASFPYDEESVVSVSDSALRNVQAAASASVLG